MDGQLTPEEFFAQGISGNRLEVLVHVRRYEDIEELLGLFIPLKIFLDCLISTILRKSLTLTFREKAVYS